MNDLSYINAAFCRARCIPALSRLTIRLSQALLLFRVKLFLLYIIENKLVLENVLDSARPFNSLRALLLD